MRTPTPGRWRITWAHRYINAIGFTRKDFDGREENMTFYDDEENVDEYIRMAEGYDGRVFVEILKGMLPKGASILELGMGPGKDLLLLSEHFHVTGSDSSPIFLDRFLAKHPDADLLQLDAVTLDTERKFDCIYSNKVLIHLTREELAESFHRQAEILEPGGILFHTFWQGGTEEEFNGLRFVYYTRRTLMKTLDKGFEIMAFERYAETEEGDSFYVILKRID
jgi:trans-aconitate methyltransferase